MTPPTTIYSRGDIILAALPFSDLTGMKKRPAVVIGTPHPSADLLLLSITSQLEKLQPGEFPLADWREAGLLFPSAIKRGLFTLNGTCITRRLGHLSSHDLGRLDSTLREWLGL